MMYARRWISLRWPSTTTGTSVRPNLRAARRRPWPAMIRPRRRRGSDSPKLHDGRRDLRYLLRNASARSWRTARARVPDRSSICVGDSSLNPERLGQQERTGAEVATGLVSSRTAARIRRSSPMRRVPAAGKPNQPKSRSRFAELHRLQQMMHVNRPVQSTLVQRNHVIEGLRAPIHVFAAVGARPSLSLAEHSTQKLDCERPVRLVASRAVIVCRQCCSVGLAPTTVCPSATGLTDAIRSRSELFKDSRISTLALQAERRPLRWKGDLSGFFWSACECM